jgi:alanine dehydrogenase
VIVGVPKEIKDGERRAGMTPDGVRELASRGHTVRVQMGTGEGVGFSDADYAEAGAGIVALASRAFDADLVVKVKEIQTAEWRALRPDSTLFCFQHLQSDGETTRELLARRITAIAYETVTGTEGGLPILAPMSSIAGELAVLIGANLLTSPQGGSGTLLRDARVTVVGAGKVGEAAARTAAMLGAKVTLLARNVERAQGIATAIGASVASASHDIVATFAAQSDLIIGAVNLPGERTPKLLTREAVRKMPKGSVIVDVCIDGGGIAETSRPTIHSEPTYIEEGVLHYCVPNMPAAVARSATLALTEAALPYVIALADKGIWNALRADDGLAAGLHMAGGKITHPAVAKALGLECTPSDALLHACGVR